MYEAVDSPWRVPFDGSFRISKAPTTPRKHLGKKAAKKALAEKVERLAELQNILYAQDSHGVLLVFQAMDAAGKDSTIRAVMSGVNPAGCQVFSFKQPSKQELDHDFLWRTSMRNPERGRIGIFNRSYYEEVLVVRVHPEYLGGQRLPDPPPLEQMFADRYTSIRDHESHLARNGFTILKFFLNVSKDEQRDRFLSRIDNPEKNWKFAHGDLAERALWPKYMDAYERALNATSRASAPWYAIPADDKPSMRLAVADIIVRSLETLKLEYPKLSAKQTAKLADARRSLTSEP